MILGHAETCQVTRERVHLLNRIQTLHGSLAVPAASTELWVLLGAALEYYNGGDQESENCTCDGPHMFDNSRRAVPGRAVFDFEDRAEVQP